MNYQILNGLAISALLALIVILLEYPKSTQAVCPDSLKKLKKGELVRLDREVSEFYGETYDVLDRLNVTYDQQLHKSIMANRHTVVINFFDFKYTDLETMRRSEGVHVNDTLCIDQLEYLTKIARAAQAAPLPLSAIDFLESYGRTEAGVLNGNFLWKGSERSCERARIPAEVVQNYLSKSQADNKQLELVGRYCVAHLRAKSWPKWDKFFEDRVTIKVGVCMPQTCHSAIYHERADIRASVDYLARHNLLAPFNSERYEISDLYCLPDETSPIRQWDLGTKVFIAFVAFWLVVTAYANYKYQKRVIVVRKLRETVDIRMIISQKLESSGLLDSDEETQEEKQRRQSTGLKSRDKGIEMANAPVESHDSVSPKGIMKNLKQSAPNETGKSAMSLNVPNGGASGASSANPSPLPSEAEDNDGDFMGLRQPLSRSSKQVQRRKSKPAEAVAANKKKDLDLVEAFSIKNNLSYLLRRRPSGPEARDEQQQQQQQHQQHYQQQSASQKRLSQQLGSVNRRASSSNEALIKDLQQQRDNEQQRKDAKCSSKVAIVSSSSSTDHSHHLQTEPVGDAPNRRRKRVNMDILDGIKVIATSWIIYGHVMMLFFGLVIDLRFADERMFDFTIITLLNTLQIVSMFYIITGALVTYLAFSRGNLNQVLKPSFWILVIVGRYLRLLPAYLLVFWFARHVSTFTGSGADWSDYRTDAQHVRTFCSNEPWSVMLTMSAADIKIPIDCVPQAWYLSNDFRTLLILPIYVILLAKSPMGGYAAILSTFVYSSLKLVEILRAANIDYEILLHWKPHVYALLADRLHDVYTNLAIRLSTYLMGVVVGHLLYLYEIRRIKQWPNWFTKIGLKLALSCASVFFMGALVISHPMINQFLPAANQVDSDLAVVLIPVFKTAMEICMATGILLIVTGSGYTWVGELLSSSTIKVMSNISYGVFLVHIEMMYKLPLVKIDSNYWTLFVHTVFHIAASNMLAFFIHLLYEMPINNIQRYLFQKAFQMFVTKSS